MVINHARTTGRSDSGAQGHRCHPASAYFLHPFIRKPNYEKTSTSATPVGAPKHQQWPGRAALPACSPRARSLMAPRAKIIREG